VLVWQVKKLEKAVGIAFLLAVFGVMCALVTELPPGYKLPSSLHSQSESVLTLTKLLIKLY
jgi:hypothetical protein